MTNKFHNGYEVCVVATMPNKFNEVIIRYVKDLKNTGNALPADAIIYTSQLEPLVQDVFKLGDHVKNKFGSMVGKISAFEISTNKAVLISDKIHKYEQKKTRYVYGVNELELHDDNLIRLVPGKWYKINDKYKLFAVQSVFKADEVMLFNEEGNIAFDSVPKTVNNNWLQISYSILKVEVM